MNSAGRSPLNVEIRRPTAWLIGLAVFLAVGMATLTAYEIFRQRRAVLDDAENYLTSLSLTMAEQTEQAFDAAETVMDTVIAGLPDRLDRSQGAGLHIRMKDLVIAIPVIDSMGIFDEKGRAVSHSHINPVPRVELGDRGYFQKISAQGGPKTMIEGPLVSRMTNKTVILLIRRIDGPDGSFRGMVTVGIDPSFFRNSFKVALIRSGSTFAIFRSDATLLARHPHSDELEGKNFSHIPLFRDLLPKADSGIFSVVGALDHQPRIIHFRRIDRYPLVLNVSLNQTKLLAEWRENAARLGGGAMAAIVLVMALIAVIVRQLRRQEAQNMAIAESEAHYRALYNDTPVMLHSLGPDLKIVSVSEYWLKKMGYSREEVVGKRSVDFMAPESRDATLNESMPEFLRTGHVEDFPVQMLTSTGELRDMLLSSAAQRDPEGNFIQSLSVMVDVTERNRLTTALRRTLEELTRSNADLEQFAYVASHDLQEPLRMVSTYVQLLSRRYRGQLDNDADDFIAYAAEGAQRMSRMINELLDYSRIQSAAKPFETVDLNVVLKTVLDNLRIRIGEKKAVIEAMKLPSLPGDRTQLTSLMQNLIANAVKYSREGVIPLVKISVHQDGDYWKFAVTDNGIGIEPPYLEKIFRLFQRLHTRDTYEGTGIGLTVCRRIVERHGGRIWAESAGLGDGCSFIFTLPNEQATNP